MAAFSDILKVGVEFLRGIFANANNIASTHPTCVPTSREGQLDCDLVTVTIRNALINFEGTILLGGHCR
jgi:hypothetical protein